jgi:phosphoribosylaminoimidazole-succinocarboxamide synthase
MELLNCELPGIPKVRRGKVREVFDLGEHLLMVTTDRISAFDCILPTAIPRKGEVLTQLSAWWFERLSFVPSHFVTASFSEFPASLQPFREQLAGRSMLVKKTQPLPVECVARGYVAGSGWKEYTQSRTVGGYAVPEGLQLASPLPEPLFTPATKAESGHDENITWKQCRSVLGDDVAFAVRDMTLELYASGSAIAASAGIILADTKFEFGLLGEQIILIDECLTPDSSRYWPKDAWKPGVNPPSFDKQFVRDYLESLDWDKTDPAPALPPDVARRTSEKYIEAYERITGSVLPVSF